MGKERMRRIDVCRKGVREKNRESESLGRDLGREGGKHVESKRGGGERLAGARHAGREAREKRRKAGLRVSKGGD